MTALRRVAERGVTAFIATWMLMAACLYNGYPFLFFDSEMYVRYVASTIRPPFYALLLYPLHLTCSLWLVAFWQALFLSCLLRFVTDRIFGEIGALRFLFLIFALTLLSSLPWIVGLVMPDLFSALLILALYFLVCTPKTLTRGQSAALTVLATVAIIVHASNLPLAVLLLLYAVIVKRLFRRSLVAAESLPLRIAGPLVAAVIILVANNAIVHRVVSVSPSGYAFLLARQVASGETAAYLQRHCAQDHDQLCGMLERPMNLDDFLWSPHSPFGRVGGFDGYRREGTRIVLGTVLEYPWWTLRSMLADGSRQLVTIDMSYTLVPLERFPLLADALREHFPREYGSFVQARQNRRELPLKAIAQIQAITLILSFCVIAWQIARDRSRGEPGRISFLVWTLFGVAVSAAVTAGLTVVHARYLNRVAWLLPYLALCGLLSMRRQDAG